MTEGPPACYGIDRDATPPKQGGIVAHVSAQDGGNGETILNARTTAP